MNQPSPLPRPVRLFVAAASALIGLMVIIAVWYKFEHPSPDNGGAHSSETGSAVPGGSEK